MIGVCGAGSWGTALGAALARNTSDPILIWGREPDVMHQISKLHTNQQYLPDIPLPNNLISCSDLPTLFKSVRDILIAVPSKAFSEFLVKIKPYLLPEHRIVWVTKGLEPERGRFLHQVVDEVLGNGQIYAVLSGPSFAKEVARGLPTAVTVATNNQEFADDLVKYFHSDTFRVYLSNDVIGVQVGGVMKNILAVAAGMSDGLGYGANARAAIITRGLAEMMRFGLALGAKAATLQGLTGVGDVILTCTDNQSRNRRFGIALAQGQESTQAQAEIGQVVEAAHNAHEICNLAAEHKLEMPIATQVYMILSNKITPQQAVQNLLSRKPAYEWCE